LRGFDLCQPVHPTFEADVVTAAEARNIVLCHPNAIEKMANLRKALPEVQINASPANRVAKRV